MKKALKFVIAIILVLIGVSIVAASFSGNESENNKKENGCYMTLEKFNQIENGVSYEDVVNTIGCDGTLSTETSYGDSSMKIYYWYAKDGISNATFSFTDNKLSAKSQIGL